MAGGARRSARIVATMAMIAALGACSANPDVDPSAAQAWLAEQYDAEHAGEIGAAGGVMSMARDEDALPTGTTGTALTFPEDAPQAVRGLLAGCFGGGTATVTWSIAGATVSVSASADIACDGELHELEPQPTSDVTTVTVDAVSHDDADATWFAAFIGD